MEREVSTSEELRVLDNETAPREVESTDAGKREVSLE